MRQPLVSVVVTTKNNQATLDACLSSIARQTYANQELIVIDNSSDDDTPDIAKRYTEAVYTYGPERSAQRNYGVRQAKGEYVCIIDSDMELGADVIRDCVEEMFTTPDTKALIIPEKSIGVGFWARCKTLERSFYEGVDTIEAARFFEKKLYAQVGGYDETMTGGEDLDLTRRIRKLSDVGRVREYILHNEGRLYFGKTARKMYYYGRNAGAFFAANPTPSAMKDESGPLARYRLFFSKPLKLFKNPAVGVGVLILKTSEYASAGFGYWRAKRAYKQDVEDLA